MPLHFCGWCARPTPHQPGAVCHRLHLVMTLMTLGGWSFVWAYLDCTACRCQRCGLGCGLPLLGFAGAYYLSLAERRRSSLAQWRP
ncbi:hypothetical protein [Ferrimonas kyonanensis]|uniref:hypothetical protein n=1 Tax=Ferrimonas kyonanensis TaxID=364763 RepID=UPI0012ECAAA7|nr:hypothetical protein [Ferrimonas kyonanensis]